MNPLLTEEACHSEQALTVFIDVLVIAATQRQRQQKCFDRCQSDKLNVTEKSSSK